MAVCMEVFRRYCKLFKTKVISLFESFKENLNPIMQNASKYISDNQYESHVTLAHELEYIKPSIRMISIFIKFKVRLSFFSLIQTDLSQKI